MRSLLLGIMLVLLASGVCGQGTWKSAGNVSGEISALDQGDIRNSLNDIVKEFESRLLSRRPPIFIRPPRQLDRKLDSLVLSGVDQATGNMIKRYKGSFEYNEHRLLFAEVISLWYKGPDRWLDLFRSEHEYDALGRLKATTTYELDEYAREFRLAYRTIYLWDDMGLARSTEYVWDLTDNDWDPRWETQFLYEDQSGKEILSSDFSWDKDKEMWIPLSKYESNYDSLGNLLRYMAYRWDQGFNMWRLNWVSQYVYDQDDRVIAKANIEVKNDLWVTGSKYEFLYDVYGDVIQEQFLVLSDEAQMMIPVWKEEFQYDRDRAIVAITTLVWNKDKQEWEDERKLVYESDKSFRYDRLLLPPTIFEDDAEQMVIFRFMVKNMYVLGWDGSDKEWTELGNSGFYYSGLTTSRVDVNVQPFNVFPNPSGGTITIDIAFPTSGPYDLEVYNHDGICVELKKVTGQDEIEIGGLKSGSYLLIIRNRDTIYTGKLIRQ